MVKIGLATVVALTSALTTGAHSAKDLKPYFVQSAWSGFGDIAVIVGNDGMSGGQLYTLINQGTGKQSRASEHFLADHVISAKFSPDGRWLAVTTTAGQFGQNPQNVTWLISNDGKQRQKLATNVYTPGAWMAKKDEYVFGANPLYKVTPTSRPVRVPLSFAKSAKVDEIRFSPDGRHAALNVTHALSTTDMAQRYDVIDLWDLQTGRLHALATAKRPDGLVLGPWSSDSKAVFYWPDPDHSASLLADGGLLSLVSLNGKARSITYTSTGVNSVIPFQDHRAVIQIGDSRYLFIDKSIGVVAGSALHKLKQPRDTVFLSPAVDAKGTTIAFLQGPVLHGSPTAKEINNWSKSLKLMTYDTRTGQIQQLQSAGLGASSPAFDISGTKILFLRNNTLQWVAKSGQGGVHLVASFPGVTPQPLEIADYISVLD